MLYKGAFAFKIVRGSKMAAYGRVALNRGCGNSRFGYIFQIPECSFASHCVHEFQGAFLKKIQNMWDIMMSKKKI